MSLRSMEGTGRLGDRLINPALAAEVFEAVNEMLAAVSAHARKAEEAYQMGVAHALCIRARIAPDHYLLGCVSQVGSIKDAIAFTEDWIVRQQQSAGGAR